MRIGVSVPGRRRDPWWDMEGRSARRNRRIHSGRRLLEIAVILVSMAVLAYAFAFRVATVRAAGGSVNLDQWATIAPSWQNGNLNGNNTQYPEGGIVPFRLAVEGLSAGQHVIHINYDFTAGGHKAYDFLATWNAWSKPGSCAPSGGGISSMCPGLPGSSSFPFPADPYVADGLSVNTAEVYSGASRRLTIWGGTIISIKGPVHSGSASGNSTADFTVTFRSTGAAVLLAWGGHLAQSAFWNLAAGGERDGAGEVSGAPWHMRTLQLDGAGNKNQDRSIQPSAIVGELPPFALAPPTPTPPATQRPPAPAASPTPRNAPTPPPGSGTTPGPAGPTNPNGPGPGGPAPTPPPTSMVAATTEPGTALVLLTLALVAMAMAAFSTSRRRGRIRS